MLKLALFMALAAAATLVLAASAQAAYLNMGISNTSNATTTLKGTTAGPELLVKNAKGSFTGADGVDGVLSTTTPTKAAAALRGSNAATNGIGWGVYGSQAGSGTGVYGTSARGTGVYGTSSASTQPGSAGVRGSNSSKKANTYGVWGAQNSAIGGAGVFGSSTTPGVGYGVVGASQDFPGVLGVTGTATNPHTGSAYVTAIWGDGGTYGSGVIGTNANGLVATYGGSSVGTGVGGVSTSGMGVVGSSSTNYGVYGTSTSSYAGWFQGNLNVTGAITAGTKDFKIDDPLDPAHKYLLHTSVESSSMMDIYNGNATTDAKGFATVRLPDWFQALNRSFRYQLTVVGRSFARAIVWKPVQDNRFTIRTDQANVRVSWQVTGIRHDPYANANRTQVVMTKSKADQGKYLHPELYGKPKTDAIGFVKPPVRVSRMTAHKR